MVVKKNNKLCGGTGAAGLVLVYGAINTDDDQMRGATPGRPDIWCHLLCKIRFSRISYI